MQTLLNVSKLNWRQPPAWPQIYINRIRLQRDVQNHQTIARFELIDEICVRLNHTGLDNLVIYVACVKHLNFNCLKWL